MNNYVLIDICSFNVKKQKEYNRFRGKVSSLPNRLSLGKPIELTFKNGVIKSKLESMSKEKDFNPDKRFVMATSNFTAIIQLKEAYDKGTDA